MGVARFCVLSYAAQIPGSTYMYPGYVSARKIFNFTLTSGADKLAAAELNDPDRHPHATVERVE